MASYRGGRGHHMPYSGGHVRPLMYRCQRQPLRQPQPAYTALYANASRGSVPISKKFQLSTPVAPLNPEAPEFVPSWLKDEEKEHPSASVDTNARASKPSGDPDITWPPLQSNGPDDSLATLLWPAEQFGVQAVKGFGENLKCEEEPRPYYNHKLKKKWRKKNPYPEDGKRRSLNRADVISTARKPPRPPPTILEVVEEEEEDSNKTKFDKTT